ncbi:class I SAM-dependent methyltransferase [Flammeovirga sp. EKP202]|uniref:class I SAM-dependent methyltransferase n=1 Tax=Flammeovirga sp. EKP202 TaxID=2770592 RepID=UPI00165FE7F2|nr:class I SAM-dependent methyltransferase [Flammeovirga sp. EKP202]MBD0399957.1 class I SAM-dependent methyltransferase [Flammeovirga sp. EKP202]
MFTFDKKKHWEKIYETKPLEKVSWYQSTPETSLNFVERSFLAPDDKIIDIGGGDSLLVDHLLAKGFQDLTVLDISEKALVRAKERLGSKAEQIKWIATDVCQFKSDSQYAFWHDRAAFHFLTDPQDIENYKRVVSQSIKTDGVMLIATFSEQGPTKCSGIPIQQYSTESLANVFEDDFELVNTQIIDHTTPFDTVQNFVFCCFRKK